MSVSPTSVAKRSAESASGAFFAASANTRARSPRNRPSCRMKYLNFRSGSVPLPRPTTKGCVSWADHIGCARDRKCWLNFIASPNCAASGPTLAEARQRCKRAYGKLFHMIHPMTLLIALVFSPLVSTAIAEEARKLPPLPAPELRSAEVSDNPRRRRHDLDPTHATA